MQPDTTKPDTAATATEQVGGTEPSKRLKVLTVCNIDLMAWVILRPWLLGLQDAGYEIHVACAPGEYTARLRGLGFHMYPVSMQRTFRPWAHIRPFFQLRKIIREGGFSIVNTHSAIGSLSGRLAAWTVGCPIVIYTAHGFYFHDRMAAVPRFLVMAVEWLMGRMTDFFMFVSDEDHQTARRTRIVPAKAGSITIYNGVDLDMFSPRESDPEKSLAFRREVGIEDDVPVIGIVGRIVREKGYREFLEMARYVSQGRRVKFLVVGDTLKSDRDQFGAEFKNRVAAAGLTASFLFTGQTDRVPEYLRIMDIFVLPSYREGFPRSIVEAMSTGLPVVATDIRGCREAVVHEKSGLIVPAKDGQALGLAVDRLVTNPEEALRMGHAGRQLAVELYDFRAVNRRFVGMINEAIRRGVMAGKVTEERGA